MKHSFWRLFAHRNYTGWMLLATFLLAPGFALAQDSTAVAADSVAADPGPLSTRSGVYTAEQALKGQELFTVVCGECHQPEDFLEGFLPGWAGQRADELFKEIRKTMPEDSPGSLRSSEYAAVIAFLFQLNGLKAGEERLPGSTRRLKEILIETAERGGSQDN
ncbi:MAG: mono/diheme cytochrome c family protein [Rhodothermales bacterium]|jgi:mono/diheme cytochrome c family protein